MHRVVAVVGAAIVFFAIVWVWGFVWTFLPPLPRLIAPVPGVMFNPLVTDLKNPVELRTDSVVGLLLALLGALGSFQASLRRGRRPTPVPQGGETETRGQA